MIKALPGFSVIWENCTKKRTEVWRSGLSSAQMASEDANSNQGTRDGMRKSSHVVSWRDHFSFGRFFFVLSKLNLFYTALSGRIYIYYITYMLYILYIIHIYIMYIFLILSCAFIVQSYSCCSSTKQTKCNAFPM